MTTAYATTDAAATAAVADRVRAQLRDEGADPSRSPEVALRVAQDEVRRHNDYALARGLAPIDDEAASVREVLAQLSGFGPLQPFLDDPTIEEVWLNAPEGTFANATLRSGGHGVFKGGHSRVEHGDLSGE